MPASYHADSRAPYSSMFSINLGFCTQRGHGLGVNLDVYTVAALEKRQHAVEVLEASLINPENPGSKSQHGLPSEVQTT